MTCSCLRVLTRLDEVVQAGADALAWHIDFYASCHETYEKAQARA